MARVAKVNINDGLGHMRLNVVLKGVARFRVRVWLATRLIRLASYILGCGISIEYDREELTPNDFFWSGGAL